MGYRFDDCDKASRWTWKFLRDSTAEQVRAVTNYALEAVHRVPKERLGWVVVLPIGMQVQDSGKNPNSAYGDSGEQEVANQRCRTLASTPPEWPTVSEESQNMVTKK